MGIFDRHQVQNMEDVNIDCYLVRNVFVVVCAACRLDDLCCEVVVAHVITAKSLV